MSTPLTRRIRQQWQRLRMTLRGVGAPRIREFYTSDFIILEGAICKVFWKVENAWRLTLEPVPVPSGYAAIDVTGRIYADIIASAQYHTLYLHAEGINGQRVSQLLDLRPLPVSLSVPSPVLVNRSRPSLPLAAEQGQLRLSAEAWKPSVRLLRPQELPNVETEIRLHPALLSAALRQQNVCIPSRLAPTVTFNEKDMGPLFARLEQLRQAETEAQARQVCRLPLPE